MSTVFESQLPVMSVSETALANNIEVMSAFCTENGVFLAPHVKTTMCAEIAERQLAAGAWGVTVANARQALALRQQGNFRRILIANQVVDEPGLKGLATLLAEEPGLEISVLADSLEGVEIMERSLERAGSQAKFHVLVEVGHPGGRTGCRDLDELLAVAGAVAASQHLELYGVETYEGVVSRTTDAEGCARVLESLERALLAHVSLQERGLLSSTAWFSAGGSVFFTEVVEAWRALRHASRPPLLLRSGCYVTHDSGRYHRLSPLDGRAPAGARRLLPAVEVWGPVLSCPEPGFAVLGIGKRDVGTDSELPVPLKLRRGDQSPASFEGFAASASVIGIYDQHLMLRFEGGEGLRVGDLVGVGISHPCTTFDRWREAALVDDDYGVLSWLRTEFH